MSISTAHPLRQTPHAPKVGSFLWAWDTFIDALKGWRPSIIGTATFIAGAALVMIFMAIFEFPGGVLPAIPVLTISLVPHSLLLMGKRLLIVICTLFASYMVFATFQEQPWILLLLGMAMVYFGLYLVGRGLDMLSYLLAVAVPILLAWDAANGRNVQEFIWLSAEQLLVGILVTGSLGAIFLQPQSEKLLRKALANPLFEIAKVLRNSPIHEPDIQPCITAESLAKIERLLGRFRAESGRTTHARNLHVVADTVRIMIGWNQVRGMLHQLNFKLEQYEYLLSSAMAFRNLLAEQLQENAEALLARRNAREIPGIPDAARNFKDACFKGTEANVFPTLESRAIAQAFAVLYEHCIVLLEPMTRSINRTLYKPPTNIPLPSREHRRAWSPWPFLLEAATKPDRWVVRFAVKGVIVGIIAFALATVFSFWGGAIVLLLMALLLTPQSMGAVGSSYMLRMLGLGLAVIVCLAGVLIVIPNINDPWAYGLLLAVALLPGAIASQNPKTVALGIGYCMSVFFMLTQPDHPSVNLIPVQDRFVSVALATSLAWLVFIGVKPIYARDRVGEQLAKTCSAIASAFRLAALPPEKHLENWKEAEARWDVYVSLDVVNHTIADSQPEFASNRERYQALIEILRILEVTYVLSRFEMRVRTMIDSIDESNELSDGIQRCLLEHAAAVETLGEYAKSNQIQEHSGILRKSQASLQEISSTLQRSTLPENNMLQNLLLAQYAGLILQQQYCQKLEAQLEIRQESFRNSKTFTIGGTQEAQSVFADQS